MFPKMLEMASHASFTKQKYSGGIRMSPVPIWYPPISMDLRLICMVLIPRVILHRLLYQIHMLLVILMRILRNSMDYGKS